jgi:hypothetical protein
LQNIDRIERFPSKEVVEQKVELLSEGTDESKLIKRQMKYEGKQVTRIHNLQKAKSLNFTCQEPTANLPKIENEDSTTRIEILNSNISDKLSALMEEHSQQSMNSLLSGMQFQGRWTPQEHLKFIEGL